MPHLVIGAAVAFALLFSVQSAEAEPYIERDAQLHETVNREAAIALAQLIQLYGWRWDSISAVTPFVFSRGFHVYCNGYSYSYDVEDKGGRWFVTVD